MMTVEGVARRIYPEHDIWSAAEPVVRRWIARELSPATRIRRLAAEAEQAVRNLARLAATPVAAAPPTPAVEHDRHIVLWFALGALTSGLAFLAGMWLR
jgi:ubiquinone biosynthesis protein